MYKESKKEKLLRFIIIGCIGLITMFFFSIQFNSFKGNETIEVPEAFEPLAVVIQERDQNNAFPIITMVKEHEEKPLLITYKINVVNDYKFETTHALELKNFPTAIEKDESTNGVWLLTGGEWVYFNEALEMENNARMREEVAEKVEFHLTIERTETEQYLMKLANDSGLVIQKTFVEEPISVLKLSVEDDLWLVLFQNDTVLLIP